VKYCFTATLKVIATLVWLGAVMLIPSARAEFPDKSILFVAPFAAGGANDYLTRLMAQHMGTELKTTIVVDNKTGANGIVGASFVAKSASDGYTVLMGNSATHGTNPSLYPNMPFDPNKDSLRSVWLGSFLWSSPSIQD
jgi:tripartite-type tricarboxylate transporter receptor subunit TctC